VVYTTKEKRKEEEREKGDVLHTKEKKETKKKGIFIFRILPRWYHVHGYINFPTKTPRKGKNK